MKNSNSTKEYRTGLKSLLDLYPSRVREKIIADAKHKQWDESHKPAMSEVVRAISEFDLKNPSELKNFSEFSNYTKLQ